MNLFEALKRGAAPRRAAYPALAGRQGTKGFAPCTKGKAGFEWIKDYSARAPAFLLDPFETGKNSKLSVTTM
ncbi:hypothetical protein ACH518_04930 [Methylomonas sp. HW2-6]|uniref:hypothetical protein n=1 Tax=Methylomonas sp. HW2-6 TaxID=3376687 RepID=UPI004040F2EE